MGISEEYIFGNTGRGLKSAGDSLTPCQISRFHLTKPKTSAYVGENRKLDSVYRVKCFQEFAETNASAPTVELKIIRVVLAVIGYRRWYFRAMDVSRSF